MQFLDRQRLITSASPHASILSWMYLRYRGMSPWASLHAWPEQVIADLIGWHMIAILVNALFLSYRTTARQGRGLFWALSWPWWVGA